MKNLLTTTLCLFLISNCCGQEEFLIHEQDSCISKKIKTYPILGKGYIVHCKCKTDKGKVSLLFQTNASQDSSGVLISQDYEMSGRNLKIISAGSNFILTEVVGKSDRYRYTFETSSWVKVKAVQTGSTRPQKEPRQ